MACDGGKMWLPVIGDDTVLEGLMRGGWWHWKWSMVVNYDGRQFKGYIGYDTMFARLKTCV